jgi:hypothetical protein
MAQATATANTEYLNFIVNLLGLMNPCVKGCNGSRGNKPILDSTK